MGYKFDGTKLKDGSRTIANVRGKKICEGVGSKTLLNIRNDKVCEGVGSKTLFNMRNDHLCKGVGSSKFADMDDVRDDIEGPGGITLAALWYYFKR